MSGAAGNDPLDAILRGEDVPWSALHQTADEFLGACAAREISPLVYQRRVRRSANGCPADGGSADGWPVAVDAELARRAREAEATDLLRGRDIASTVDALAAAGVPTVLLKGAALAYSVYDSPGSRPRIDTDVFIKRDHVDTVRRTMARLGYVEPPLSDGELIFCQFAMEKRDRFGVDHAFDFHWKISTQSLFAGLLAYDEIAADASPVPALGGHARASGPVHALLLACVHPAMHHRNTERLLWIYDVHLLVTRMAAPELERFAAVAAAKQVAAICARQLTIARTRFHTPVPESVMRALTRAGVDEPSAAYLQPARRWHAELASNVRHLPGRERFRLLREVLLPSARYMKTKYRLGGARVMLLPAAYVFRGLNGVLKILRGRK